jgi:transposase InsO family protein
VSKARLIITAVIVEGRSQADVARDYGISQAWVSRLIARYRVEGETAFEPRSRRPHTRPDATPANIVDLIIELREQLTADGLDAGADTIVWHLQHHQVTISRATVYRIIRRANLVTAEPKKKPRSSYIRFQAEQPNETWQADFTHHRLADSTDTEILTWLDDHARYALSVTAHRRVTGPAVVNTFRAAIAEHGTPFSTLTDNGLVFTTRFAHGGRTSRNALENELITHGVLQNNSRPNHPTTCGKVERFQQTLKKWLRTQPPANTIAELQHQLDTFKHIYNHQRPHRSLPGRTTPAVAYTTRPKATPHNAHPDNEFRVRHDRVSSGSVTLRVNSQLHHIGLGQPLNGTRIIMLIHGYNIRVIHATTGEIIRTLTIDPNRRYHGTGPKSEAPNAPTDPEKTRNPNPDESSGLADVSRHHIGRADRI